MARGREQEEVDGAERAPVKETVSVPVKKVGKVIGRRGQMIRELVEKSGATIDVTDEVDDEGKTVIKLSGTEETVRKARSLILATIEDEPRPARIAQEAGEPIEFKIPKDKGGLVIGSRGSKIREIQQETRVGVNVGSRDTAVDGMIIVTLTGEPSRCEDARRIIESLITESENGPGRAIPKETYSCTMQIPVEMTRNVIGPQGSTIREIQDMTGVQVDVARRKHAVDGMIDVRLTGRQDDCYKARSMIEDIVEDSSYNRGGRGYDTTMMMINESMCGLVIGARGSNIRSIQENTGARIRIDKSYEARDGMVQVAISGNPDQQENARSEITRIINESGKERNGRQGSGPAAGDIVLEVWVPESRCGMIIGRKGSKITEIQARTDTRLDVNSTEKNDEGMCLILISGFKREQCEEAKAIVMDIVNDEDRSERPRRDPDDEGRGSMEVWVDTSCLGRLIGKGGSKIKEIENAYHVKIDVKKDQQEENETKVVLIGTKRDVLATKDYIYEIEGEVDES